LKATWSVKSFKKKKKLPKDPVERIQYILEHENDPDDSLLTYHGIDAESALVKYMSEEIAKEMDLQIIKSIMGVVNEKIKTNIDDRTS